MVSRLFEMFVYSVMYVFVITIGTKIIGALISPDFEKRIVEGGSFALGLIISSFFIGVALIFSSIAR